MSYRDAFAGPGVYLDVGTRFGAAGPRRHNVSIRATGAKEIRVTQVNNGGSAFLGGKLGQTFTVKTWKKQKGSRADSPARLRIRVFWKAGGDEWFDASVFESTSLTFIPSPGMAGTDAEPPAGGGGSGGGSGSSGGGYSEAFYDTVPAPTPWGKILLGSTVAAAAGFLGFKALRG